MSKKWIVITPLLVFVLLCGFLLKGLFSDPRELQSGRVNQPLPAFDLPDLMDPDKRWTNADLQGQTYLLNVWGTWCPTCLAELGYLTELREQGVSIVGLYYEQGYDPDFDGQFNLAALQQEVRNMLARAGDPYQFNMLDLDRQFLLDLGVSGAPETFLINSEGKVLVHHTGDINQRVWRAKFAPLMQEAQ
ncbi:redoxin family protein [Pseudoalteromonas ruthenica]|uniref:redoxin family protein n=1 Tax=Pseudoalteromonas ruthenica TaxID=151081 RepID=UPI000345A66B|nr:redoxin family protein [Pseudoalteromonas ruthenica]